MLLCICPTVIETINILNFWNNNMAHTVPKWAV